MEDFGESSGEREQLMSPKITGHIFYGFSLKEMRKEIKGGGSVEAITADTLHLHVRSGGWWGKLRVGRKYNGNSPWLKSSLQGGSG